MWTGAVRQNRGEEKSMRMIDADAIPYTMLYKENWLAGTGCEEQGAWKRDIDAMPTIEERKKGKWIREGSAFNLRCPYCRKFFVEPVGSMFKFCPNCGMRGTP